MTTTPPQRQPQSRRADAICTIFFVLSTIFLASAIVSFGKLGWPGMHWDSALYGTPVINVANGKGWIFGSYAPAAVARPDLSFNFHGLLHVIIYGQLLKTRTWQDYLYAQGIVTAVGFAVYTLIYSVLLNRGGLTQCQALLSGPILATIPAVIGISLSGRPEQPATLLLSLPLLAIVARCSRGGIFTVTGISLGLLGILSPLVGAIFSLTSAIWIYVDTKGRPQETLKYLAILAACATITAALTLDWFTPLNLIEWVDNLKKASGSTIDSSPHLVNPKYINGFSQFSPLWSPLLYFFGAIGFAAFWRSITWLPLRLFCFTLIGLTFTYIGRKGMDYTFITFIPFALGLFISKQRELWPWLPANGLHWRLNVSRLIIGLAGFIYLASITIWLSVAWRTPIEALSLDNAQRSFEQTEAGMSLKSDKNSAIGYPALSSPSLVVLGKADQRFSAFWVNPIPTEDPVLTKYEKQNSLTLKYFLLPPLVPQTKLGFKTYPPEKLYVGNVEFALLKPASNASDRFGKTSNPTHFINFYNYSIYKRVTS